jgi:putative SOS response-associated peptidase YedK
MCGRITATFEFSDSRVRWNLDRDLPEYTPRFNIAPETSPNIPVIIRQGGANECRLMHWGLIPHWATDPSIGNEEFWKQKTVDRRHPNCAHVLMHLDPRPPLVAEHFDEPVKDGLPSEVG